MYCEILNVTQQLALELLLDMSLADYWSATIVRTTYARIDQCKCVGACKMGGGLPKIIFFGSCVPKESAPDEVQKKIRRHLIEFAMTTKNVMAWRSPGDYEQ